MGGGGAVVGELMARRGVGLTALLIGLGAALGLPANKAFAQSAAHTNAADTSNDHFRRDRNISVAQRRQARDDGAGWRVGSFLVRPELDLEIGYTDNFAADETDPQGSAIYEADVRLSANSDWGRHALNASLYVPTTSYGSNFTTTDAIGTVDGRFDVDHSFSIDGGVGYGYRSEPLGFSPAGQQLGHPLRYQDTTAHVGFIKTFNRLRLGGRVGYGRKDYGDGRLTDGTVVSFDERDVSYVTYDLRADYAVSDSTALFVSAGANTRDHRIDLPVNQDSQGYEYLVGANFDLTHLIRGEVGVGYLTQTFDDPAIKSQSGLAVHGSVDWFPDPLVTVNLGAQRSIQDSYSPSTGTFVGTDVNLIVGYEFRRNINVTLSSGYSDDEYNGIDRHDTRWNAYAGAEYEANRMLALTFSAGHQEQSSSGVDRGRNYDANVAFFGVRLRR